MNDAFDLHQNDETGPTLDELVSSLNADQSRVFKLVKSHLEHQAMHERKTCTCHDLKPLHMFVSGVGGTRKSFLIKTVCALVSNIWDDLKDTTLCAVTAPTGLAAFNVGGITIHRLLQLPIEHEGKPAGYWRLGRDAQKVMRTSLSQLRLLIIDEVSMVSNLNLAYIHLRLDELFGRDQWFGGVNVLFVGDILQLPPVNGAPVFDKMTNKAVAQKLGCMTSINIWQDTVVYDELTINERQKQDQAFSSMLNEVRRGFPSKATIEALQDRVITEKVVDKFEELLTLQKSPLCLFPTHQSCQEFNTEMLSRLKGETKEIPCIDEVDETTGKFKWTQKAKDQMKKLNTDCNLTAGLEAVLQIAIGARVMLRRNIDTRSGLVNGAIGTVLSIKTHHITVQFDGIRAPCDIERVKSKFMVLKKIYVHRKQFPLILAFAVTVHKCQGLSLDCAMMDLSNKVFCAGMALSRVKKLENLHLIAFTEQAIKVSSKCLQEIKQTYRPDLPQYTIPCEPQPQKRKRKQSGTVLLRPKRQKVDGKRKTDKPVAPPPPAKKKCPPRKVVSKPSTQPRKEKSGYKEVVIDSDLILLSPEEPVVPEWYQSGIFNPLGEATQRRLCRQLGLRFIKSNGCTGGGADVPLRAPRSMHRIQGDGNCLFRAFSYAITGSERQHLFLRRAIIHYMRTTDECMRLYSR